MTDQERPFENLLEDLKKLVIALERGDLPLEKSFEAYENGVRLAKEAHERLAKMEAKIELLTQEGELVPFESPHAR